MYYDSPKQEALWDIENQFMFGSQILVSPKVNLKFVVPDELIMLGPEEFQNTKRTPVYEIEPILPEIYYDWTSKQIIPPGQH